MLRESSGYGSRWEVPRSWLVFVAVAALTAALVAGIIIGTASTVAIYAFGQARDARELAMQYRQEAEAARAAMQTAADAKHQSLDDYWNTLSRQTSEHTLRLETNTTRIEALEREGKEP